MTSTPPTPAAVTIKTGTKVLKYNFNTVKKLEELRGKAVSAIFDETKIEEEIGIGFIIDAIYCGLLYSYKKDRTFTPDWVGDNLLSEELNKYGNAIGEALKQFLPQAKEEDQEDDENMVDPSRLGTGNSSKSTPLHTE